jgi:APA family basic amino acid/polyamine antiporter
MIRKARPLKRILGLGFGLALAFGGTVGVGILRLPGTLAAELHDSRLILLFWVIGGIWALLGAVAIAELAALLPEAGGFYVYARRAFGNGAGFFVGWSDWVNLVAAIAYAALTAVTFLGALWPGARIAPRALAIGLILLFAALHWIGLRMGSTITRVISVAVGLMLGGLVVGCYVMAPATALEVRGTVGSATLLPLVSVAAVVTALRSVFVTYDGWYSPIYLAEESTEPALTLPRAIIGGTILIAVLYVLVNMALLRVLPIPKLAASTLPAADAARLLSPHGGAELVTVISLLTLMSAINAFLLMAPRILFAIGRDGFFTEKAAQLSASGTPRVALTLTAAAAAGLVLTGTFEQIIAIAAVLFLLNYVSAYAALIVLRLREPGLHRPYRAWGYPVTTALVLAGCIALWVGAIVEDPRSASFAALLLLGCIPLYAWLARRRRRAESAQA